MPRCERDPKLIGEPLDEAEVLVGILAAQAVVEMPHVDGDVQFLAEFGEGQQECRGVGPAGDGGNHG